MRISVSTRAKKNGQQLSVNDLSQHLDFEALLLCQYLGPITSWSSKLTRSSLQQGSCETWWRTVWLAATRTAHTAQMRQHPPRTAWPSIYGCAQCLNHAAIDAVLARVCAPAQKTGSNERLSNWPSTPTRICSLFVRLDSGRRQHCGDRAEDQMTTSHYGFIMISVCGALERTKKQWRDLMVAAGYELQVVRMYDGDELSLNQFLSSMTY